MDIIQTSREPFQDTLRSTTTRRFQSCQSTEEPIRVTMSSGGHHLSNLPGVKEALKTVRFDVWKYDTNDLLNLLEGMYNELGFVQELSIHPETLKRFLTKVQQNYQDNPFHNFRHCFCVTQMMYVFIHACNLAQYLNTAELCALITACICHDLDHPGLNNAYQINARTELAVRYKDASPLENHHCAMAFKILSMPECNIFANSSPDQVKRVQNDVAVLILATDMTRHAEILKEFKERSANFDFKSQKDLTSLKMILIKACDVSNEIRPATVSEPWVDCLLQEYFLQSDVEKRNGLPCAPHMDPDRVTKSTSQIAFIRFVLLPLFETFAKVLPQIQTIAMGNLRSALSYYEDLKSKEEELTEQPK